MHEQLISISRDYSPTPAGRFPSDGPFNGERFRCELLIPRMMDAIRDGRILVVSFDDADSFSSSFLEEAFGGLVRSKKFSRADIQKHLKIISHDEALASYVADANDYVAQELSRH